MTEDQVRWEKAKAGREPVDWGYRGKEGRLDQKQVKAIIYMRIKENETDEGNIIQYITTTKAESEKE